jgi:hypothetical protein
VKIFRRFSRKNFTQPRQSVKIFRRFIRKNFKQPRQSVKIFRRFSRKNFTQPRPSAKIVRRFSRKIFTLWRGCLPEKISLNCVAAKVSRHMNLSDQVQQGIHFHLLSTRTVNFTININTPNFVGNKLPLTQVVGVSSLMWQHVSTSEGHLQASSIKYVKWNVHNCSKFWTQISVSQSYKYTLLY